MSPERLRQVRGPGAGMVFQDPMTSLNPVLRSASSSSRVRAHDDVQARPPAPRSSCSARWAYPIPTGARTGSRTSCPAACGSGWSSRSRWRTSALLIADEPPRRST